MRLSWKSSDGWSGDEEPHQCSLPGVPPDPSGHHHLLRHAAHGDSLEAGAAQIFFQDIRNFSKNLSLNFFKKGNYGEKS